MNVWMFSAGILSLITMLAHTLGGGPEIHAPALASNLMLEVKAVISVIWHWVTAVLLLNGIALIGVAKIRHLQAAVGGIVAVQYFSFAVLFVYYGLERLDSLLIMPQWIVFAIISGLSVAGIRKSSSDKSQLEGV